MSQTNDAMKTTMPRPAPVACERILQHLRTLGVLIPEDQLDDALRQAEQYGWSHLELLDRLFGQQAMQKRERMIERRIREARFCQRLNIDPPLIHRW